ncbi:MAG: hypothetical protein NT149_04815, partial [Candidatus Gottesmanbacteria bacterium]|nr:hypothetical protein [Candidatus Gottesmanbacteria bacterium]
MFKGFEREPQKEGEKSRVKDIPLGESAFTPEQSKALERKGYIIYPLTGQSIASLRDAGHPFWSTWHKGESFETLSSLRTEVAINPNRLFLPKSNGKTLDEQLSMVVDFGKEIGGEVTGTTAILGGVSDYAEVAFGHLDRKGQRLFDKNFNYDYARTITPTGEFSVAIVGCFNDDHGLRVGDLPQGGSGDGHVWAVPLVVP